MSHFIRLLGPWQAAAVARYVPQPDGGWTLSGDQLPTPCTVKLPGGWAQALGEEFRGVVRFARRFHKPTGLGAGDRVWLIVDVVSAQAAKVELNGEPHCPAAPKADSTTLRFEITGCLLENNLLFVEISHVGESPPPEIQLVGLEIEAA